MKIISILLLLSISGCCCQVPEYCESIKKIEKEKEAYEEYKVSEIRRVVKIILEEEEQKKQIEAAKKSANLLRVNDNIIELYLKMCKSNQFFATATLK